MSIACGVGWHGSHPSTSHVGWRNGPMTILAVWQLQPKVLQIRLYNHYQPDTKSCSKQHAVVRILIYIYMYDVLPKLVQTVRIVCVHLTGQSGQSGAVDMVFFVGEHFECFSIKIVFHCFPFRCRLKLWTWCCNILQKKKNCFCLLCYVSEMTETLSGEAWLNSRHYCL